MAGNTINIDLSVQDQSNSIKSRTSDAKKLNEQLALTKPNAWHRYQNR